MRDETLITGTASSSTMTTTTSLNHEPEEEKVHAEKPYSRVFRRSSSVGTDERQKKHDPVDDDTTVIRKNSTFDLVSSSTEEEEDIMAVPVIPLHGFAAQLSPVASENTQGYVDDNNNGYEDDNTTADGSTWVKKSKQNCCNCQWDIAKELYYVAMFSIYGLVIRIFVGRLLGSDCSQAYSGTAPDDFLAPFFSRICVTNNGQTDQTGGALFTDLPANIVGCFIMGMISVSGQHAIPWFHTDHSLQKHDHFLSALRTGLCGCITTFASWNTQMVVMIDGTDTVLGSQVAAGIFGYLVGICASVSAFLFGQHVHGWLAAMHTNHHTTMAPTHLSDMEEGQSSNRSDVCKQTPTGGTKKPKRWERWVGIDGPAPILLAAGIFVAFLVADQMQSILYYRAIWISTLMAPFGSALRCYLKHVLSSTGMSPGGALDSCSSQRSIQRKWSWVPWGTLAANLLAASLSIAAEALIARHFPNVSDDPWVHSILKAVQMGFCGCLSTVSTLVKEMVVDMERPAHTHIYLLGSFVSAMLISLLIYSPTVRS